MTNFDAQTIADAVTEARSPPNPASIIEDETQWRLRPSSPAASASGSRVHPGHILIILALTESREIIQSLRPALDNKPRSIKKTVDQNVAAVLEVRRLARWDGSPCYDEAEPAVARAATLMGGRDRVRGVRTGWHSMPGHRCAVLFRRRDRSEPAWLQNGRFGVLQLNAAAIADVITP